MCQHNNYIIKQQKKQGKPCKIRKKHIWFQSRKWQTPVVRHDRDGKLYLYDILRTKKETSKPSGQ